jgi:hypothetical protein
VRRSDLYFQYNDIDYFQYNDIDYFPYNDIDYFPYNDIDYFPYNDIDPVLDLTIVVDDDVAADGSGRGRRQPYRRLGPDWCLHTSDRALFPTDARWS